MTYWKMFTAFFTNLLREYRDAKASGSLVPWYTMVRRAIAMVFLVPCRLLLCFVVICGFGWDAATDMWERTE